MKKIFITCDMEGVSGCTGWDSVIKGKEDYFRLRQQMTRELVSVVNSINDSFSDCEVVIKDAHDGGDNILIGELPENCKLITGWYGGPMSMIQGLDETFDCSIFLGYHSGAGVANYPISHTYNSRRFARMTLNGKVCSEFTLNYLKSWDLKVPVVLVSGDADLCEHINDFDPRIQTVAATRGYGASITSKAPARVNKELFEAFKKVRLEDFKDFNLDYRSYELEIEYSKQTDAIKASFYPGTKRQGEKKLSFSGKSIDEILVALLFI